MPSFPRRYRRNLGRPDPTVSMDPPPTTTTTMIVPLSPSSISSSPQGTIFSGGVSPPLIAGFISIGAFAVAVISMCAWCRYVGRRNVMQEEEGEEGEDSVFLTRFERVLPARFRWGRRRVGHGHGQGRGGGGGVHRRGRRRHEGGEQFKAKPEMFDVWISGERIADTLKWEAESDQSLPFSATLFTTGPPVAEVLSRARARARAGVGGGNRDSVEEEEEEEKRCTTASLSVLSQTAGNSTLQVAVLLRMPSPPSTSHAVMEEAQNDTSVLGELAIGLVEAPWTSSVHPSSREGEGTTTTP